MRSILLVAQVAPPSTLVAARRVAGFTKYLARLGHRVTVLTSRVSGDGPIEGAARGNRPQFDGGKVLERADVAGHRRARAADDKHFSFLLFHLRLGVFPDEFRPGVGDVFF